MNYNINIGSIIAKARKKKNISQNALAKKLFVTRQAISNWEHDKTKPDISVIFKLCKVLDIDIKTIVDLDSNIKIENLIEVEKKKTNRRNLIFSGLIILVFIAIVITLVIVINRNAFTIYNVYLDSDEFSLNNSIIVKSKVRNYFQLGTLVSKLDITNAETVYNIRLYKKNGEEERLIFSRNYTDNFSISESYGYGEYFTDLDNNLDNLYLEISFIEDNKEYVYNYQLRVEENFHSDSLVYFKNNSIGNYSKSSPEKKIATNTLINNGYNYDDNADSFTKMIDNKLITYYPKSNLICYKKTINNNVLIVEYFIKSNRLKISNYDTSNNTYESQNYMLDNYDKLYQEEINFIKSEWQKLGGN